MTDAGDTPDPRQASTDTAEAIDPIAAPVAGPPPTEPPGEPLRLSWSAVSDVGRVRKDNQDSGYAGPWLLAVCDGVGGAARGDVASGTAVQQLRRLDEAPGTDLLPRIAGALHRAHDRIAELVEDDPALAGTSTTATVVVFDGHQIALGHLGDSRAYLWRDGTLSQLTTDHTFVQTLIDDGRITEAEARTHPHRNLILKALDGVHETEPDLFTLDVAVGDRVLVCSDGVSGFLDNDRIARILGEGTPDYAAVELVRLSLESGSTDNVTAVVGEVVGADTELPDDLEPLLVGAAADLPRQLGRGGSGPWLFRGHRSGDTGEIEPVPADLPPEVSFAIPSDPIDPERARYAPQAPPRYGLLRVLLAAVVVLGLAWAAGAVAWSWSRTQYFVAEHDGYVTVFRGLDADVLGWSLGEPYEQSDVPLTSLPETYQSNVRQGMNAGGLADAREMVTNLAQRQAPGATPPGGGTTASPSDQPSPDGTGQPGQPDGTTSPDGPQGTGSPGDTATPSAAPSDSPLPVTTSATASPTPGG